MLEFPFSSEDWQGVSQLSTDIVNASMMEDHVLRRSAFAELQQLLRALAVKYGEHPVLLETEADFADDSELRCHRYSEAKNLARQSRLPIRTICLSLARLRIELGDVDECESELSECKREVEMNGDRHERAEWEELGSLVSAARMRR